MSIAATSLLLGDDTPAPPLPPTTPIQTPIINPQPTPPVPTPSDPLKPAPGVYPGDMPRPVSPEFYGTAQDYQGPGTIDTKAQLDADPNKATVEGRLKGILNQDSELLQAARAGADRAYNSKGLLMSAGGAQAGQGAVIDKALQIATPDAKLYGDASLNNQLADIERQKGINTYSQEGALQTQRSKNDMQIQMMQSQAQMRIAEVENQWKDAMNIDALQTDQKKALMGVVAEIGTEFQGSLERIFRDPGITEKQPAIAALLQRYQAQITTAGNVVGIKLTW